jgi:hypothetical protein
MDDSVIFAREMDAIQIAARGNIDFVNFAPCDFVPQAINHSNT